MVYCVVKPLFRLLSQKEDSRREGKCNGWGDLHIPYWLVTWASSLTSLSESRCLGYMPDVFSERTSRSKQRGELALGAMLIIPSASKLPPLSPRSPPSPFFLTCRVVADTVEKGRAGSDHQLARRAPGPAGANEVHGCIALQA